MRLLQKKHQKAAKPAKQPVINNYTIAYLDKRSKTYHKITLTAFAGIIGLVGVLTILSSSASVRKYIGLEAEAAVKSGNVSTRTDATTSGGSALRFDAPSTSATPTPTNPTPPPDPANLPGWGLPTMRDEFNGSVIDTTKWNVRSRSDLGLLNDAAVPTKEQVSVSNGILHIKGDWLDAPLARPTGQTGPTLTHKTGYIDQRLLNSGNVQYTQQFGRWEIRAKVPTGNNTLGALPAFWLRNSGTGSGGEIDIMEAWGYTTSKPFTGQRIGTSTLTFHEFTSSPGWKNAWTLESANGASSTTYADFHTWAFEYLPDKFSLYFDGKLIVSKTKAEKPEIWGPTYQAPWHVRLNLHVGPSATYWGLPDWNNKSWTQPLDFQIDYVRVWKYGAS